MKLYEIDEAIANFDYEIDEETGEILNMDELDKLNMSREQKVENIAILYKNGKAETDALIEERNRLDARIQRSKNRDTSLFNYLKFALRGESFSTTKCECTFRPSESIEIPDDYLVPDKFCELTITRKPVKSNIKKYLKGLSEEEAEKIEWARIEKHQNLSVK